MRTVTGRPWTQERAAIILSALLALALFLLTLQTTVNGSEDRYATDVGEIQNALPRWGTIHFTGYPQYTALGSFFVNGLRLVGAPPATGASLFSALWGALAAGLLTALILQFAAPAWAAASASLLFTLSTSMWVDGSLAELHTMTMALTFAALLVAIRFWRRGETRDLYWLVFICSQGLTHQRAFAFLAPALVLLTLPHWRLIAQKWLSVLALALTGPLTYLYLPLVDWLGSDWVFSTPGTWEGFWALVLDTKAERIISIPGTASELQARLRAVLGLLSDDWPTLLWISGLGGLAAAWHRSAVAPGPDEQTVHVRPPAAMERAALMLTWIVYLALSLIVWEGYVSDALLAVKLPVVAMAAVGLAFIAADLTRRSQLLKMAAMAGMAVLAPLLFVENRPRVTQITKDNSAAQTITLVSSIPAAESQPVTFMALWGNDFWQLAYAQAYEGQFSDLNLVDHNANFREILARGDRLFTLGRTFLTWPLATWESRLGDLQLSSVKPGIVEIRRPLLAGDDATGAGEPPLRQLGNGIAIQDAQLTWQGGEPVANGEGLTAGEALELTITWRALEAPTFDFSVAVHLVSEDPPAGPQHLLAQADSAHPVGGWYPTSQWQAGELVQDHYLLQVPQGAQPVAVRISMYRVREDGPFENSEVLSLPLPEAGRDAGAPTWERRLLDGIRAVYYAAES